MWSYLTSSTSCVYLLFVVVRVRKSKVVFFHQVQVLAHLKEQILALGTFLQRERDSNTKIKVEGF